jgi:hypothetical protein
VAAARPSTKAMKTALFLALVMYGIAFVISMLVALLVKGLFNLVRRFSES